MNPPARRISARLLGNLRNRSGLTGNCDPGYICLIADRGPLTARFAKRTQTSVPLQTAGNDLKPSVLSTRLIEQTRIGPSIPNSDTATHDEWLIPRKTPDLANLPQAQLVRVQNATDLGRAVGALLQAPPSLTVKGPSGLCAELTEQPGRRLVHLVNYHADTPARNINVTVQLPKGEPVKNVRLARLEHDKDADLEIRRQEKTITCVVPAIDVYGIIVVTWDTQK